MSIGRAGASATLLIDKRVLVAGGNNGAEDLSTAEIYYPFGQIFDPTTTNLSAARSGHAAVLLPWNGERVDRGRQLERRRAQLERSVPVADFPRPVFVRHGRVRGHWRIGRAAHWIDCWPGGSRWLCVRGRWIDANGQHVAATGAEGYRFATIKTDKDDTRRVSSLALRDQAGEPNSEVTLLFQEDPAVHDDYILKVPTDGQGNIDFSGWAQSSTTLNVRFYLTAFDSVSRAQTTFTDEQDCFTVTFAVERFMGQ